MSIQRSSNRFAAPEKIERQPVPLAERGRMLFVPDIVTLLGQKPDGTPRKSAWWVRNSFAPELRHKLGRDAFWWEADVTAWLDRENAA